MKRGTGYRVQVTSCRLQVAGYKLINIEVLSDKPGIRNLEPGTRKLVPMNIGT
jgi:hypothetical protein